MLKEHLVDALWLFINALQEAQVYAQENGLFFMETSAKTATNVNDIFYEIGKLSLWIEGLNICMLTKYNIRTKLFENWVQYFPMCTWN